MSRRHLGPLLAVAALVVASSCAGPEPELPPARTPSFGPQIQSGFYSSIGAIRHDERFVVRLWTTEPGRLVVRQP